MKIHNELLKKERNYFFLEKGKRPFPRINFRIIEGEEPKAGMENRAILREWFDRVDSQKTGNITAAKLKSALAVGNLQFSLSVVQQMIRMYDFDSNGTMSFEEFFELNKFLLKVQQEFSSLERGRGFLVPDEAYEALVKIGFSLDSPAFYTVCESFDQTKSGKLKLDDFISLCIFVQSARNLFNSFDTSKQGRVTLDFNQFVYCTSNCRI
ncbi:sorcin-like [Salvia splendens]|uniref:sorcin-like n=1 Tax=Salvia splendens TaxID=180675 RepID=UPI001C26D4D5|nr:sorcin-like [Salvia splendens]